MGSSEAKHLEEDRASLGGQRGRGGRDRQRMLEMKRATGLGAVSSELAFYCAASGQCCKAMSNS